MHNLTSCPKGLYIPTLLIITESKSSALFRNIDGGVTRTGLTEGKTPS
jgi:hypothetical protein